MTRDRNGGRFDRRQRLLSATLVAWAAAGALASAAHADLPSGAALVQGGLDRAGKAVAIERLEEFAFALPEGAALDPRLPVREFEVVLQSELALASAGNWQFEVEFEGGEATLELVVDGRSAGVTSTRPVVGATGSLVAPLVLRQPAKVELRLAFRRRGSERARVRTFWSLAGAGRASFVREPLPARALQWPAAQASAAAALAQRRAGQVALVELGCVACHDPGRAATALPERARIDLTGISARAAAPWLRRWIASPQRAQPGGGMPELLAAAPAAAASEVDALLAWLSESERAPAGAATATASAALAPAGQALYDSLGCIACHGVLSGDPAAAAAPVPSAPFGDLAGKWQLEPLAAFLRDPLATRPHGRMPAFALGETESLALAAHLLERFGDAAAATAAKPETAPPDAALVARGRARFEELGCAACHVVAGFEPARAAPSAARPLAELDASRGCLATTASAQRGAPRYALDSARRDALRAALQWVREAAGAVNAPPAPAPLLRGELLLTALRCDACHEHAGRGGPGALGASFHSLVEADLGDEGRLPPRLDAVGARLATPWIERVVANGERARPYLAARMPQFGAAHATVLADALTSRSGVWRSDEVAAPASDEELATVGRRLAGSGGMNCVTCHSFGDRPSAGTPGLDFLQFSQRLRPEWLLGYLLDPARQKPGTRMPRYFEDGRSVVGNVLDGDPARQAAALWSWFERAGTMPAPEGVPSDERRVLAVGDRPRLFRCFLPRAGNRGLAIGTPSGLHFSFDADQVRLVEAWQGEFLDVAPVWEGRGGGVANLLGPVVWSAPAGPLLQLGTAATWPDANGRATGAKYLGHRVEPDGTPVIEWQLREQTIGVEVPADPTGIVVEERFLPDPRPDVLFVRRVTLRRVPPDAAITLLPLGTRVRLQPGSSDFVRGSAGADLPSVIAPRQGSDTIVLHLEVLR